MSKAINGPLAVIAVLVLLGASPSVAPAQEKAPDQVDRCIDPTKDTLLISVKVFDGDTLIASPRLLAAYGQPSSATFNDLRPGWASLLIKLTPTEASPDKIELNFDMIVNLSKASKPISYAVQQNAVLSLRADCSTAEVKVWEIAPRSKGRARGQAVVLALQRLPS